MRYKKEKKKNLGDKIASLKVEEEGMVLKGP